MKIKHALLATTAAVLLTTGGIASAQQSAPAARDAAPAASGNASGNKSTTPSAVYQEIDDDMAKVATFNVTVKDLGDMEIYGADGKKIGNVDRVLGDSSKQPKAVAVDVGGFLGMGTHEVIFPLDRLTRGKEANRLQTSMTKEQVENLDKWEARDNMGRPSSNTATGAGGQPSTTMPKR
jgi:hypothetical protein